MSVSVKELIDEVLFKLNQNINRPKALARSNVLREINNGLIDLAENTTLFPKTDNTTLSLATDISTYALPSDFYELISISDDQKKDLYPTTLSVLQSYSWYWQNESGEPRWYILNYDAPNTIRLFQTPDATWNTRILTLVYYQYMPKVVSETENIPTGIQNNHKMLVDFCLSQLYKFQIEVQNEALSATYDTDYKRQRNKWAKKSVSPPRLLIIGSGGQQPDSIRGPQLPSNYPSLR